MRFEANTLIPLFTGVFFSILFLQSGLDKVFNWKSEEEFNKKHFEKTFLKATVPLMLAVLTLMEISTGLLSVVGLFVMWITGETAILFYGNLLAATTFLALFFGQRISKDYGGAQSLVSYFIVSLIAIYFSFPALP